MRPFKNLTAAYLGMLPDEHLAVFKLFSSWEMCSVMKGGGGYVASESCEVLHNALWCTPSLVSVCSCWNTWEWWSMKPWTGELMTNWSENLVILWRNCSASCWNWMRRQWNQQSPCRTLSRFPSYHLVIIAALRELMEQGFNWGVRPFLRESQLAHWGTWREHVAFPAEGRGKTIFVCKYLWKNIKKEDWTWLSHSCVYEVLHIVS